MARLVSELGADVIDDTVKPEKFDKKKRNYIVGLSCVAVGAIALGLVYYFAASDWLSDYQNMAYITYSQNVEPDTTGPFKGQITASIVRVDNNSKYPSDFKIPRKINGHPITRIDDRAFQGCNRLTRVTMSNNIVSLGDQTFAGCEKLKTIKFSNNITSIGNDAFEGTLYKESWANNEFTYVGEILVNVNRDKLLQDAGKSNLIFVDSDSSSYISQYPNAVAFNLNTLKKVGEEGQDVHITKWMDGIFRDFKGLQFVELPSYLETIPNYVFQNSTDLSKVAFNSANKYVGDYSFDGCSLLSSLEGFNNIKEIGDYSFSKTYLSMNSLHEGLEYTGTGAFSSCSKITSMTLPSSLTSVSSGLFKNSSLSSLSFANPDVVTSIGTEAFRNTNLTTFTFPKEIKIITDYTLAGCKKLESVNVYQSKMTRIDASAFNGSSKFHSMKRYDDNGQVLSSDSDDDTLYLPSSLENLVNTAGGSAGSNFKGTSIKHVIIPETLKNIADSTFEDCKVLEDVTFFNSERSVIRTIGQKAFSGCSALTTIDIPNTVRSISSSAFAKCTSLVSAHLPEFKECSSYQKALLNSDTRRYSSITVSLFDGCTALNDVVIPSTVSEIQRYAFRGCSSLTRVSIPSNVTTVRADAFADCSKNLYISVEALSLPSTWATGWNSGARYVLGSVAILEEGDFLASENSDRSSVTIISYNGTNTDLVIPEKIGDFRVSGINDNFLDPEFEVTLTSISIPDSITDIGSNAFANLLAKEDETITTRENGYRYLGNASNKYVALVASYDYTEANAYKLNDNVRYVSREVIDELTVKTYKDGDNDVPYLTLRDEQDGQYLASMSNDHFALVKAKTSNGNVYKMNENVKMILTNAFYQLSGTPSVVVSSNVEFVMGSAFKENFSNLSVYSVELSKPNGWDFKWNISAAPQYWATLGPIENDAYKACENLDHSARLTSYIGESDRVNIPNTLTSGSNNYPVTQIASNFLVDSYATYLYIPSSVTKVEAGALKNNPSLTIYLEASSAPSGFEDDWDMDNRPIYYSVNNETHRLQDGVDYVVVGDHVVVTGYDYSLEHVAIPSEILGKPVTTIGREAFANSNLLSIHIPTSVTVIESKAFANTDYVKIYFAHSQLPVTFFEDWNVDDRPYYLNVNLDSNYFAQEIEYEDGTGRKVNGFIEYVVYDNEATLTGYYGTLQDVEIPDTIEIKGQSYPVKTIGACAFEGSSIDLLTIGENVESIETNAFSDCYSLIGDTVIDTNVKFIGSGAFNNTGITLYVVDKDIASLWPEDWSGSATVYIGVGEEWEYVDNRPTPITPDTPEEAEE